MAHILRFTFSSLVADSPLVVVVLVLAAVLVALAGHYCAGDRPAGGRSGADSGEVTVTYATEMGETPATAWSIRP